MALTYTIPGLQTQLDAVAAAIAAGSFAGAWAAYANASLVLVGLPVEIATGDTTTKMRTDLEKVGEILERALDKSASSDRRRLIRFGVRG